MLTTVADVKMDVKLLKAVAVVGVGLLMTVVATDVGFFTTPVVTGRIFVMTIDVAPAWLALEDID